jgi:hypothetical protein
MIEGLREADDFKNFRVNDFYRDIAYLPFAVLAIGGLIFTLVAWAQSLEYIRASAAKACKQTALSSLPRTKLRSRV